MIGEWDGVFGGRKNELVSRRNCFDRLLHGDSGLGFSGLLRFAFGLKGLELLQRFLERALKALFIEADVGERLRLVTKHAACGQGGVNLGIFGVKVAGRFEVTESEDRVFDRADAVQTPLGVAESLRVLPL